MMGRVADREADVIVAGGGTGGVCAAIAAARNGVDVLLVERYGFLGGLFTHGNMCVSTVRPWAGIGKEIFDTFFDQGAAIMHPDEPVNYPIFHHGAGAARTVPYDPETAMQVLFQLCEEAGVRLLLHSYVTGVVADGNVVKGVIVENKAGAAGQIGTDYVAKAPADGYTLLIATPPNAIHVRLFQGKLPYNFRKDFVPVVHLATYPLVLVSGPQSSARAFEELVAEANRAPGKLMYGSSGPGSSAHLAGELMQIQTGARFGPGGAQRGSSQ